MARDRLAIATGTLIGWVAVPAYFISRRLGDSLIGVAVPLLLERPER